MYYHQVNTQIIINQDIKIYMLNLTLVENCKIKYFINNIVFLLYVWEGTDV